MVLSGGFLSSAGKPPSSLAPCSSSPVGAVTVCMATDPESTAPYPCGLTSLLWFYLQSLLTELTFTSPPKPVLPPGTPPPPPAPHPLACDFESSWPPPSPLQPNAHCAHSPVISIPMATTTVCGALLSDPKLRTCPHTHCYFCSSYFAFGLF